jgi:hypothetical protein
MYNWKFMKLYNLFCSIKIQHEAFERIKRYKFFLETPVNSLIAELKFYADCWGRM